MVPQVQQKSWAGRGGSKSKFQKKDRLGPSLIRASDITHSPESFQVPDANHDIPGKALRIPSSQAYLDLSLGIAQWLQTQMTRALALFF
jgi:hypothetical protein